MNTVFERIQRDIKNIEQQEYFERFFSRYDLESGEYAKPKNYSSQNPLEGLGGVPLSWKVDQGYVYTEHADNHTLIIGPTASKKSRLVTMPTVRMLGIAKESMIISDPKSEIYNRTAGFLKANGYHILVLNLRDPKYGASWNPLAVPYELYCQGDIDRAYEFINDIATNLTAMGRSEKEPFWDNSAGTLFSGLTVLLFKYCKEFSQSENVVHIGSVLKLRNVLCAGNKHEIMRNPLWQYAKSDLHISSALIGTLETADDTRAGILSTFDQKMRIFSTQPNLINMLSVNEIVYDELDKNPTALFLLMPDEKTTYHGLISLFIKQSYEYLIYKAQERNENHDARLNIRLNYVLDEFSSLPTVGDFPAMITAARSRNIRFNIVIQSKHQLVLKYGEDTDTILSNCTNWIFLTSRELKFLEEISALCGQKQNQNIMKPVLSIAELQRFDKNRGEVLILSGRFKPYLTRLPDIEIYDKNRMLKEPRYVHRLHPTDIVQIDMQSIMDRLNPDSEDIVHNNGVLGQSVYSSVVGGMKLDTLISLIDDRIKKSSNDLAIDRMIAEIDKKISELDEKENQEGDECIETSEDFDNQSLDKDALRDNDGDVLFGEEFDKILSEVLDDNEIL